MQKDIKDILAPIKEHLQSVDSSIQQNLFTGMPDVDESALHLFTGGGKRIRASLVILTCGLGGGDMTGVVPLAAATEIVHAATLIHDDIIDHSLFRRGVMSVPHKWGNKLAVLVGDYMYTLALSIALSDPNPAIFPLMVNGTKDMVRGELYQLQYSNIESITREHYMNIIELKTAKFMGACSKLGATKACMTDGDIDMLHDFGLNLGFAFQIIDDALDIRGDESGKTGKDFGNDFKDGKITLPVLYLIEKSGPSARDELKRFIGNPDEGGWDVLKRRIQESGALEYTVNFAKPYIERAMEIIERFPGSPFKTVLGELTNFLLYREY